MKKVFFGLLSVVSLAGLVACGNPANSAGEMSESPEAGATLETEAGQGMPEKMPAEEAMPGATTPAESPMVSDSDIEMTIQENLATLYPDTQFEVTSEAGAVTIAGNIPSQDEADYIAEWVAEMDGVTDVEVQSSDATTGAEELP